MAHDVFLSYSTQDKAAADAVCHSLESKGIRCWIAPRDVIPGANWQQSILDAIAGSRAVVLIFTAHTNQSENVKKEVSAAFTPISNSRGAAARAPGTTRRVVLGRLSPW